ncbi:MAG: aminotransferase class IV [Cytophagales bacterium]|nr:aminotransferase class IV [Bernardetiaceae bacterium]MDW8205157.1 aminotransferase class IV [Cytophagales bacterium]
MSLLLETIRVANRTFYHLAYHQMRIEKTLQKLFSGRVTISLSETLTIPHYLDNNVYKCRVVYDTQIRAVQFLPYALRPVRSLQIVEVPPDFDYSCKWANRTAIDQLKQKITTDDILIVRNGKITDTSYANVALWDGYQWFTPQQPLLEGTKRAQLLAAGILSEADIGVKELRDFKCIKLLNAMMEFSEAPVVEIAKIV